MADLSPGMEVSFPHAILDPHALSTLGLHRSPESWIRSRLDRLKISKCIYCTKFETDSQDGVPRIDSFP